MLAADWMHQPVLWVGFAAPVPFDTEERPKGDGTEDTFWELNEYPSNTSFGFECLYLPEISGLRIEGLFAAIFAHFSLYLLWKTCPLVQAEKGLKPVILTALGSKWTLNGKIERGISAHRILT